MSKTFNIGHHNIVAGGNIHYHSASGDTRHETNLVSETRPEVAVAGGDIHYRSSSGETRPAIEKWLFPSVEGYSAPHIRALDSHYGETGRWFLEGEAFTGWKSTDWESTTGRLLWIRGEAGTGKSVLCASAINAFRSDCPNASFAYFYFNRMQWDYATCLKYLVFQLGQDSDLLRALYEKHRRHAEQPTRRELEWLLKDLLKRTQSHVFLDALDECPDLDLLMKTMPSLFQDSRCLFTSRPYPAIRFSGSHCNNLHISNDF